MKLISLWEPWATLMAIGAKRIETRSWGTPYRGWLAIHASQGGLCKRDLADCLAEPEFALALGKENLCPGKIVAVVNLVDCLPVEAFRCLSALFDDYPELDTPRERAFGLYEPEKPGERRWGWVTSGLFRLPDPIPFKSHQGMFDLTEDVVRELRRQWKEVNPK